LAGLPLHTGKLIRVGNAEEMEEEESWDNRDTYKSVFPIFQEVKSKWNGPREVLWPKGS
jgi:hypothetical protein